MTARNTASASETPYRSNEVAPFVYEGEIINARGEMLSLTSMWRAAKNDPQKAPAKWRDLPSTKSFVEHVELTIGKSDSDIFATQNGGKNPGTWAHWQIALAYAKYLSPAFHMWCNTVVRERMEVRPSSRSPSEMELREFGMVKSLMRELTAVRDQIRADSEQVGAIRRELVDLHEEHLAARRLANGAKSVVGWKLALTIAEEHGVPQKGRGRLVHRISHALKEFCVSRGYPFEREFREDGRRSRPMFSIEATAAWLRVEGHAMIAAHLAKHPFARNIEGQGVFRLVQPGKKPEA